MLRRMLWCSGEESVLVQSRKDGLMDHRSGQLVMEGCKVSNSHLMEEENNLMEEHIKGIS